MGGWRDSIAAQYAPLVWLLASVFFGSLLGVKARSRREMTLGDKMTILLTGLGGAALASLMVLVIFFLYAVSILGGASTALLAVFETYFGPLLIVVGIVASCGAITFVDEGHWF